MLAHGAAPAESGPDSLGSRNVSAIVAAGGASSRMGSGASKSLVEINGVPLLMYSLMALERSTTVSEIVLVISKEDRERLDGCRDLPKISKLFSTILGGPQREDSVQNGLNAVDPDAGIILIHDAARPMLEPSWVDKAVNALADYAGVIYGTPVTDTLKRMERDGLVRETVPRQGLFAVQTPQVFASYWIRRAHDHRKAAGLAATDDAALVEMIGGEVKLLTGTRQNLKVTYPEDLETAAALLRERAREWFGRE